MWTSITSPFMSGNQTLTRHMWSIYHIFSNLSQVWSKNTVKYYKMLRLTLHRLLTCNAASHMTYVKCNIHTVQCRCFQTNCAFLLASLLHPWRKQTGDAPGNCLAAKPNTWHFWQTIYSHCWILFPKTWCLYHCSSNTRILYIPTWW